MPQAPWKHYNVIRSNKKGTDRVDLWANSKEQVRSTQASLGFQVEQIEQIGTAERHFSIPIFGGLNVYCNVEDDPGGCLVGTFKEADLPDNDEFNASMDAIEALILAHACAGIDVAAPAYLEGLETAIMQCNEKL